MTKKATFAAQANSAIQSMTVVALNADNGILFAGSVGEFVIHGEGLPGLTLLLMNKADFESFGAFVTARRQ